MFRVVLRVSLFFLMYTSSALAEDLSLGEIKNICNVDTYFEIVNDKEISAFDSYKEYKALRMAVEEVKSYYPEYRHRTYLCLGNMLIAELQLLGYYLRDNEEMVRLGYRGGEHFRHFDFRNDAYEKVVGYFKSALHYEALQPENNRFTFGEMMAIGGGIFSDPSHREEMLRRQIEEWGDEQVIGLDTDHPVMRSELEVAAYLVPIRAYAEQGNFGDAERLLDELSRLSESGADAADEYGPKLIQFRKVWVDFNTVQEEKNKILLEEISHIQSLIWAIAEAEDESEVDMLFQRARSGVLAEPHASDYEEGRIEGYKGKIIQDIDAVVEVQEKGGIEYKFFVFLAVSFLILWVGVIFLLRFAKTRGR